MWRGERETVMRKFILCYFVCRSQTLSHASSHFKYWNTHYDFRSNEMGSVTDREVYVENVRNLFIVIRNVDKWNYYQILKILRVYRDDISEGKKFCHHLGVVHK